MTIPEELCFQGVGEIQYDKSKTSHHSFGRSQIILQAVSTITGSGGGDVSSTISSAVGSLMYTIVCNRPDLAYAVSTVSRFMSNSGKQH